MVDFENKTIRLSDHWRLDGLPSMCNIVIDGGGVYGVHFPEGDGGGVLSLKNVTLKNIKHLWIHPGAAIEWIDIDGLAIIDSLSGLRIDAPSIGGGRIRNVSIKNLSSGGKVAGLWLGCNSDQQPELPPITVHGFNASDIETTGGKECHALTSFAQPIHLSEFDIRRVRGGNASEAVYTKSSYNTFSNGTIAESDGQGALALKGRGVGQYAEGNTVMPSVEIINDKAMWVQSDKNIIRAKTTGRIKEHKTLASDNFIEPSH